MNIKRIIFWVLLVMGCVVARAQTMSVESFRLLDSDLTANTRGTMEYDQNGDVAALIKIITTQTGFVVDGGMMGIVKTRQEVAEFWVYVPHGIQRFKLRHPQLGQLEYYFPMPIEKARTYELVLTTSTIRTIVDDQHDMQYLVMNITPKNASVFIDDKLQSLDEDGTLSILLPFGNHQYRIEAASYLTKAGAVTIGQEKQAIDITLESAQGELTLESPMPQADIYLNERYVGTGSWTGKVDAGNYIAEVRLDGYRTRSMSIVIEEQEVRGFTLPMPQPMYGSLQVTSTPKGAEVFVDSVSQGVTPLYLNELLAKKHQIIIKSPGYQDYVDTVAVKESERSTLDAELSDVVTATFQSNPSGVTLLINGTPVGNTPYTADMASGDYQVTLELPGYEKFDKTIHLSVNKPNVNIKLWKICLTDRDFYIAPHYQALGYTAYGVAAGAYLGKLNLEAYYDMGATPAQTVFWSTEAGAGEIESPMEYEYKIKSAMGGKLGLGFRLGTQFRFTPQAGFRVVSITGESTGNQSQKTYIAQATAGLRMEYSPFNHFAIVAAPEYYLPVKTGQTATMLKDVNSDINRWYSGVAVKAGFEIYF